MELKVSKLNQYIEKFATHLTVERNLSSTSIKAYCYDLNLLNQWYVGGTHTSVTESNMQAYFAELMNGNKLKDSTVKRKYISVKSFFQYLLNKKLISDLPIKDLGKNFKKSKRIPKTLSVEDVQKLLISPQDDFKSLKSNFRKIICTRNRAIIELLFSTGIRIGELVKISLADIDLSNQTLLILGKGRKERILYLSSCDVLARIKEWLETREELKPKCNSLFINKYGNRLTIYSIEDIFYKYRNASNINEKATPHYLRHTFATQLLDNGADLRSVQEILGHSNVSTTEIYTEVSIQRKKDVLSKFNPRHNFKF